MFKHQTLVRSAIASALFSAVLVTIPAQAGLLGGSAGTVGRLAGGASGSFGPGNMNVGGTALGQGALSTNSTNPLPRGDKALNAARQVTIEDQSAKQAAATNGTAMATGSTTGAAQGSGEASAIKTPPMPTTAPASTRSAQMSANGTGTAQASRDSAQVRGDASAQGSVGR